MFGTQHLAMFVFSGILLNLTPGQDTLYIVGRSVSQGRQAGLFSVMGIMSGSVIHTVAAAFGLSAILASSAQALVAVKVTGGGYLAYLGLQMLRARAASVGTPVEFTPERRWAIYRAALFTNALNPKVGLFFLAFLPQFVAPTAESRVVSFLFLGGVFIFNGTVWCLVLVWGASAMRRRLRQDSLSRLLLTRATGAIFVALGVRLVIGK